MEAVGMLEVYGFVSALAAVDAACKAANVTVEAFDRNKPANAEKLPVPLLILVKLRGRVSDINAAVAAGAEAAERAGGLMTTHVIAQPDQQTQKMLSINEIK